MSDPDPLLAAVLAERHIARPECAYDLIGVGDGVCPECGAGLRIEIGVGRRAIDRIGAALIGNGAEMLAVASGVTIAMMFVPGWMGLVLGGAFFGCALASLLAALPNGRTWPRLVRSARLAMMGWWGIVGLYAMLLVLSRV